MKTLPLGYSTYKDIVGNNRIYVDKTKYFYNMIDAGKFYFLSRPRRFGKSLTISTLKEIFLGNKDLFKGTYIYESNYNWKEYTVIHFDFSKFDKDKNIDDLNQILSDTINVHATEYNITLETTLITARFDELIRKLSKIAPVVILIDEYDNPIISNISDIEKANSVKDILKGFYKIIKACDEYLKFAFLTGVTKFSQVSVFSGLNNLTDITMDKRYSAICGYTQEELENSFKDYINKQATEDDISREDVLEKIKSWYNGFLFSEDGESVYNPWSTLSYFNTGKFKNYWFETGTPTFLIDLIKRDNFNIGDRYNFSASLKSFSTFDIEKLRVLPLLFQTGYLSISSFDPKTSYYTLDFPNNEVKESFLDNLLESISDIDSDNVLFRLHIALQSNDLEAFFESMDTLFAKIDYDLHLKDEKYWQSMFYMILTLLGYKIHAEFKTIKGRIDAFIETDTHIYIFEFKTRESEEIALEQIRDREYYTRFRDCGKEIVLIGSRFVLEDKKIVNKYITDKPLQ